MLNMMLATALLLLLGSTCLPAAVKAYKKIQVASETVLLPYHQLMTPSWLKEHSTITGLYSLNPQYLQLLSSTADYQQRLQVQLVAPHILTATDCLSVTVTIAMDTTLADSRDHDPTFGISDGKSFVGFHVPDKGNYHNRPPCYPIEGDNVNGILSNAIHHNNVGLYVTSRLFSSEVKMQIRPTEKWASCHTEHNEGHTNIGNYQRKLDFTNGLFLDMYQADKGETYKIKYIVVDVNVD